MTVTMTPEEYREFLAAEKKKTKYRSTMCEYNGAKYHSKLERNRAIELDDLLKAKKIIGWTRQVPFYLGTMLNKYVVDFLVFDLDGTVHAEDAKGMETPKFKRNKKRWELYGPCPLWVISKKKTVIIYPKGVKLTQNRINKPFDYNIK